MGAILYYRSTGMDGLNLDPDYRKIYDFAKSNLISLPPKKTILLQNKLIVDLKDLGVFQKWDSFYMGLNNFDTGEAYARINWINPSNSIPIIVSNYFQRTGDTSWDKDKGFRGPSGGNGDYSWHSLFVRNNYVLTDASIFGYCSQLKTIGSNLLFSGNSNTASTANGILQTVNQAQRINQSNQNPSPVIDMSGIGHKLLFRVSTSYLVGWNNLIRQTSGRNAVSVDNNQVAFSVGNDAFVGFGGRGGSFDAEAVDYMDLMNQYIDNISS